MSVVHGPWGSTQVKQTTPVPGEWWRRADDSALWVWCSLNSDPVRWHRAPVPMAKITRGLPDRPPDRGRITAALDLCAMVGPEVDEALGVHNALDTTVDAWEAGAEVPTHDDIRRLATLTGRRPEWFYEGPLPSFTGDHVQPGERRPRLPGGGTVSDIVEAETAPPAWERSRAPGIWAIVEIMGHKVRAGSISDIQIGGATMLRIQHPTVPDHEDTGPLTEIYAPGALFSVRPVTRQIAVEWAEDRWRSGGPAMVELTAAADAYEDDWSDDRCGHCGRLLSVCDGGDDCEPF